MISHGKNVKVFCANANRPFAEGVCRKLWLPLGDSTVTTFADGEVSVTINESVRGSDVFLVQSTCKPVNNTKECHKDFFCFLCAASDSVCHYTQNT